MAKDKVSKNYEQWHSYKSKSGRKKCKNDRVTSFNIDWFKRPKLLINCVCLSLSAEE